MGTGHILTVDDLGHSVRMLRLARPAPQCEHTRSHFLRGLEPDIRAFSPLPSDH